MKQSVTLVPCRVGMDGYIRDFPEKAVLAVPVEPSGQGFRVVSRDLTPGQHEALWQLAVSGFSVAKFQPGPQQLSRFYWWEGRERRVNTGRFRGRLEPIQF